LWSAMVVRVQAHCSGGSRSTACLAAKISLADANGCWVLFTSTEVVYGVTGTDVSGLPEYGVSP
jgi:hypothetical protein